MKTTMVYLAAGSSRRFGSNKLFYPLKGEPLYLHLLKRLSAISSRHEEWEVLVVTRYRELEAEIAKMHLPVRVVFSPDSEKGMSQTIRCALGAAPDAEAYAFFVADQPYLTEETAERFLLEMEKTPCRPGCVRGGGHTGNPVWFPAKYKEELLALSGDRGGKEVLKGHWEEACFFQVKEERELWDIDRAEVRPWDSERAGE